MLRIPGSILPELRYHVPALLLKRLCQMCENREESTQLVKKVGMCAIMPV